MTRPEILGTFPDARFGGMEFAVPALEWIRGPLNDFFRQRYWNEGLEKWTVKWECYDFARAFCVCAAECWALTPELPAVDAISIGEFFFIPDFNAKVGRTTDGHAICACFCDAGLVYIDPQSNDLWPITPAEFRSRYFVRF